MRALANSVCLLALSSGMYERESTANYGTARHRTALCRAVELAKLNGATKRSLVPGTYVCGTT